MNARASSHRRDEPRSARRSSLLSQKATCNPERDAEVEKNETMMSPFSLTMILNIILFLSERKKQSNGKMDPTLFVDSDIAISDKSASS